MSSTQNKLNIRIILNEPYPYGMACTNRIHAYAKGLHALGHDVVIILPRTRTALEGEKVKTFGKQYFEGIRYYYATGSNQREGLKITRFFKDLAGSVKSFSILRKEGDCNIILLISSHYHHILLFKLYSRLLHAKYVLEKSELPKPIRIKSNSWIKKMLGRLYIMTAYKMFDGILVISSHLESYFSDKIRKGARLLIVPILVDNNLYSATQKSGTCHAEKRIVYAGTLCQKKDGILDLLKAFALLMDHNSDIKLQLIGNFEKSENKLDIQQIITEKNLSSHVEILGFLPRQNVLQHFADADALVLYKPGNKQNEYSFPTKLGEYLMTGNPVVTTRFGEIAAYLEDGKNAYLAEPDNIEAFTSKMFEALFSGTSREIGMAGKQTAGTLFNYIRAAKNLTEFFYQLMNKTA